MTEFTIRVPASSANIGPGFDVLGIGLELFLEIKTTVEQNLDTSSDKHHAKLEYTGNGADGVPLQSEKNLVTQTALYVMRCNGVENFPMGTRIHVHNPIPLSRGLGSSGAAIVGGVMLGDAICGLNLSKERMLDYCLLIERHPDNIAAAMLGGFVGSYLNELLAEETAAKSVPLEAILPKAGVTSPDAVERRPPPAKIGRYMKYNWNNNIKCIAIVPQFEVKTDDSRAVLPLSYTKDDIVFNLQRLALLTSALTQEKPDHELIYESMRDKIHQPYRASLIPGLSQVLQEITPSANPGLCGICLSGAGPTILCLATENFGAISASVISIFAHHGIKCELMVLALAYEGALITH